MNYLNILLLVVACSWSCRTYKILAIFPVTAPSHYAISSKLLNELAKKGHEVTVFTPYLQQTPVKNLKEVSLSSLIESGDGEGLHVCGQKKQLSVLEKQTPLGLSHFLLNMGYDITEKVLQHEKIQTLLKTNEQYDLIMLPQFLNEGLLSIAHHFKTPLVLLATMPLFPWSSFLLSHPSPPSYVPNLISLYSADMNFWQRLTNSFYDAYMILYHQWIVLPKHRELVKKYVPGQPDLYNFLNNASLILINSHMSTYEALPHVPNAIEVGGLHTEEPKKLPEELQKFLDNSINGVVVFALGSNLNSSELPCSKRDEITKAFSKLKQNVLWKWETNKLPRQPKNVKIMKWFPQSDVLAQPNVKAFVTHGGLLSIMESIYHEVPIIGIPFFIDQKMNMATAVSHGYGIRIYFNELSEERLTWALNEVLTNPKYLTIVKNRSKIMRDRPMKPIDTAIYWIEYVIRHQGAPHLKYPGTNLTWYQRSLLDVISFILVVTFIVMFVIVVAFMRIVKRIYKTYDKNKKNN